ncbi:MAG: neutral/alkaline non-lysosomal ceramidase N-terminal domain-containing protein [Pirellulales bacterium]|nr:neutral/alkaline non-lysosomal ceramidase N-terminal domain-containing protein [Pirellulales bacterium]
MAILAGAARREINPSGPTALFGYPHVERISQGIHDSLWASALCIKNDDCILALVSLDILFLDPPTARDIRKAVAEKLSTEESCVFISCTHTHSGPVTSRLIGWQEDETIPDPDPAYLQHVKTQTVAAASEALAQTRLAEIAWTTADATGVGGNRHAIDGVTDPEVGILLAREIGNAKELLAAVIVYGMHPTVLHEDSRWVSSDFPHYTREYLAKRFGEQLTVIYHTAPCGNQSPRYHITGQTFDEAQRLGEKLGAAVADSIESIGDDRFASDVRLWGKLAELELQQRTMPSVEDARKTLDKYRTTYKRLLNEGAPRPEVRTAECAIFGAEGLLSLARARNSGQIEATLNSYRPLEVQAIGIGKAALLGIPGECFTEYALDVKKRAGEGVFVVSLVNGELQGYIVTPEAAAAGGYEATNALFSPESGKIMVDTLVKLLEA